MKTLLWISLGLLLHSPVASAQIAELCTSPLTDQNAANQCFESPSPSQFLVGSNGPSGVTPPPPAAAPAPALVPSQTQTPPQVTVIYVQAPPPPPIYVQVNAPVNASVNASVSNTALNGNPAPLTGWTPIPTIPTLPVIFTTTTVTTTRPYSSRRPPLARPLLVGPNLVVQ